MSAPLQTLTRSLPISLHSSQYDTDGNGAIDLKEFTEFMVKMGVAPMKDAKNKEGKESDV